MTQPTPTMQRDRRRFGRPKYHHLKTDMTPMVDLGFILITFFVMTVQLSKPVSLKLAFPTDGPPTDLGESGALTVLLASDNQVFYYHGKWEDAIKTKSINTTNYSVTAGIGKIIRDKQALLDKKKPNGRKDLMLLVKPLDGASYKNVVDVLDEALIYEVGKYAVLKPEKQEIGWIHQHHQ